LDDIDDDISGQTIDTYAGASSHVRKNMILTCGGNLGAGNINPILR
jgi:hypothetical protein